MAIFYFAQIALPLFFLVWLQVFPPTNRIALLVLTLGATLWLSAIWLGGIWFTYPRWLVPASAIFLVWVTWRNWHCADDGIRPTGIRNWIAIVSGSMLGVAAIAALASAVASRAALSTQIVELANPLFSESYVVAIMVRDDTLWFAAQTDQVCDTATTRNGNLVPLGSVSVKYSPARIGWFSRWKRFSSSSSPTA